jgi:hypothetical protein
MASCLSSMSRFRETIDSHTPSEWRHLLTCFARQAGRSVPHDCSACVPVLSTIAVTANTGHSDRSGGPFLRPALAGRPPRSGGIPLRFCGVKCTGDFFLGAHGKANLVTPAPKNEKRPARTNRRAFSVKFKTSYFTLTKMMAKVYSAIDSISTSARMSMF